MQKLAVGVRVRVRVPDAVAPKEREVVGEGVALGVPVGEMETVGVPVGALEGAPEPDGVPEGVRVSELLLLLLGAHAVAPWGAPGQARQSAA